MKNRLMGVALIALALFFTYILLDGTIALALIPLGIVLLTGKEKRFYAMSVQESLSE